MKFTITKEHIALIQRMNILWNGRDENGAPMVDLKRPYGNSDVISDIAEIIVIKKIETDGGDEYWPVGTSDRCNKLHIECGTALKICLYLKSFELGVYEREDYLENWRKVA